MLVVAFQIPVQPQNYSECQAPDAHMNPKCNGSNPTGPVLTINGTYAVEGTTPEGGKYTGSVIINGSAQNGFQFNWTIGADKYSGTGTLSGNVLTVDWGAEEPVVYVVTAGGKRLAGKWGKQGKGRENLARR